MKATVVTSTDYAAVAATGAQAAYSHAAGSQLGNKLIFACSTASSGGTSTFNIEGRRSNRDGATAWTPLRTFSIAANGVMAIGADSDIDNVGDADCYDQYRINCTAYDGAATHTFTTQAVASPVG